MSGSNMLKAPIRTAQDIGIQIARGELGGAKPFSGFGSCTVGGAVANQLVFPNTDYQFFYPDQTTGESVTFVSTNAEDGAGTETGILTIHVHYLDVNLEEQFCTVELNGTTPVTTVTFEDETTGSLTGVRFIQCMHLATAGAALGAVGDVFAYRTGATTPEDETFSIISATEARCSSAMRMVPKGKRALIDGATGSSVSTTADSYSLVSLFGTEREDQKYNEEFIMIPYAQLGLQNSSEAFTFPVPLVLTEGSVMGAKFTSNKANITTVTWFGWLEDAPIGV
jgi:hypothetical protein